MHLGLETMYMGDPFNYPMPNRKDLMSLGSLSQEKDGFKMNTRKFASERKSNNALYTQDIQG